MSHSHVMMLKLITVVESWIAIKAVISAQFKPMAFSRC